MSSIKSNFAESLRNTIRKNNILSRKTRINHCCKIVNNELVNLSNIMLDIIENEEIYKTIHVLRNFTDKYHEEWNVSKDNNDILNTAFCEDYF